MMATGKPIMADFTFIGFFPCVSKFMVLQYVLVSKATVTRLAGKDFVLTIVLSAIVGCIGRRSGSGSAAAC